MIFFTSDTHFGHKNMTQEGRDLCNRGFSSVHQMNEALIRGWNERISHSDTVFHLGDVAMGPYSEWDAIFERLNGYKVMVIGNHDRVFEGGSTKDKEKFEGYYEQFFDQVVPEVTNMVLSGGTKVNLSHFPYDGDSHGGDRYSEFRLKDEGTVLIHGHTHSNGKFSRSAVKRTPQVHVGVDAWDFRPVSEYEVINVLRQNT